MSAWPWTPDPSSLPPPLNSLPPELVKKWTISDDVDRSEVMAAATDEELEELVATFTDEMYDACDAFLDTDPREEDSWLIWVSLAASEALIDLERRGKKVRYRGEPQSRS